MDRTLKVADVMTQPVETLPQAMVTTASDLLPRLRGFRHLPVVDAAGCPVGMVTRTDVLEHAYLAGRERAFRVADLMNLPAWTVEADTPLATAARLMLAENIHSLPVVDGAGRLVGLLTERDLRTRLGTDVQHWGEAPPFALGTPVVDVMVENPLTLRRGAPLLEALEAFTDERIGALPVLDEEERPVGIVSYVDVLAWLRGRIAQVAAAATRVADAPLREA